MLTIYRRGRIFWARGSVAGKPIRCSLDTQIKEVAHQRMIDLELHGGRRSKKWSEFEVEFHQWKQMNIAESTRKRYKWVVKRFGEYLNKRRIMIVHDITPEVMSGYAVDRQNDRHPHNDRTLAVEGLRQDLRILHGAFSYAVKCGYMKANPIITPGLNTTGGKTMPFTQEEISRLLNSAYTREDPSRFALVLAFLYTGLRISDVSALERKSVNFEARTITLRTQKRQKDILLSLHPELHAALQGHIRSLSDGQRFSRYLFPTRTGKRFVPQSMDAYLRRIFTKAGIEDGHAHRFRDMFAVRLLSFGASLYDIAKMMGITVPVAEKHYSPYVKELQERNKRQVDMLDFTAPNVHAPYTTASGVNT